jgi:hypothetical protein
MVLGRKGLRCFEWGVGGRSWGKVCRMGKVEWLLGEARLDCMWEVCVVGYGGAGKGRAEVG